MTPRYRHEFREYFYPPEELIVALTELKFEDESWHNDTSPHFESTDLKGKLVLDVWCDAETQEFSEFHNVDPREWKRFTVIIHREDEDIGVCLFQSSDVREVVKFLTDLYALNKEQK